MSDHNVVSLNAWRDFNDASPQVDPFDVEPDAEQIAIFLDLVFGYCDGWVPLRGFIDKGQGIDGRPHNAWWERACGRTLSSKANQVGSEPA